MTSGHFIALLRQFRNLAGVRDSVVPSDRHLLERFTISRDEAAFAALLRRHGSMVWGVCRRVLADSADADDAFQATFLVLLHKAATLQGRESLGGWLQGVAWRLARRVKAEAARRRLKEGRAECKSAADCIMEVERRDLRGLLDEELDRLPEKYRAPLVLCYLEGMTYTEAARQLGWRDGTVCGRLARARELLQKRLSRRGVTLWGAALIAALSEPASAPAASMLAAARMAALFALGQTVAGAVSPPVATLAHGVLKAMSLAKLKTLAVLVALCCVLAGGGGLAAHRLAQANRQRELPGLETSSTRQLTLPVRQPQDHRDRQGDPLPPDAIARLGTTRFRHGDHVFYVSFSPDGTRLISADWYGARLWDATSGREIRRLGSRFQTSLRSVSVSADGKKIALADHHSGTIQILDTATGKLLSQFNNGPDNNDLFCAVRFSPNGKVLASYAGKLIRLWDPAAGTKLRQWQADAEQVHHIEFSNDSKTLISGGEDKSIRFWDTATAKEVRRIADQPGPITRLALSPDGNILASRGSTRHEFNPPGGGRGTFWVFDNKIQLWDMASGKKLRLIESSDPAPKNGAPHGFFGNAISNFVFAPDGKSLVTSGPGNDVRLWYVREGKEMRRWDIPGVNALALSSNGKILAAGISTSVHLWDTTTGRELREHVGHSGGIRYLALSPNGRHIASTSTDRTVRIWDAATGRELHRLREPAGDMVPIAFSANGRTLTTVGIDRPVGGSDKKGRVWDVVTGKELRQLPDLGACSTFAVSTDGRLYAFAGKNKQVWLWDAVVERKLPVRIEHPQGIIKLSFSPDARALFGWCGDRKVHAWDVATGREQRQFAVGDGSDQNLIAFSPDGRWLAWVGQENREVRLYDMNTGAEVRRLKAAGRTPIFEARAVGGGVKKAPPMWDSPAICCLAFAPDGRMLAGSSMYDPAIYLWETATGQVRHRLAGHEGRILTMIFSADSKHLLSGSEDTTAILWDLMGDTGERGRVSAPSLQALWGELASEDAETAYRALRGFVIAVPAVDFLRKQLRSIPEPDAKLVARWIADLDHDQFARREQAAKELERLGETVEPALRTALTDAPSLELRRRIESLLAKLPESKRGTPAAARLRMLRAIEVLERIGTVEAKELLRKLAGGAAGALQTREAKAALKRWR